MAINSHKKRKERLVFREEDKREEEQKKSVREKEELSGIARKGKGPNLPLETAQEFSLGLFAHTCPLSFCSFFCL